LNIYTVVSPLLTLAQGSNGRYTGTCTQGGKAISGGFMQGDTAYVWANSSIVGVTPNTWIYELTNDSSSYDAEVFFETVCAK